MAAGPRALGIAGRAGSRRVANIVVAGGGMAAGTVMRQLGERGIPGKKLLVFAKDLPWAASVPRHHLLGQSREGLSLVKPAIDPYYLKQKMPADEFMRQQVDHQTKAVELLPDDADCIETNLLKVIRQGRQLLLTGEDGSEVLTDRLFMATGVGPERELWRCGVHMENEVSGKRRNFAEVTTAVESMNHDPSYWKGKSVTIYGGGPTAAWVAEVAMSYGIRDILWISKDGFDGANPSNRNSETLLLTEGHRIVTEILSVRYRGGASAPPGSDGLEVTLKNTRAKWTHKTDIIICAAGSDPLAPTGVQSVLGPLYRELVPHVGRQKGVYACTEDQTVFVVSTALTSDRLVKSLIEGNTFPVLNPENHVVAGMRVGDLSAKDAVEAAMKSDTSGGDAKGKV
jgi:thioredoxin reductase